MAKTDFFISYAPADRDWADWIAVSLEAAGYRVILSHWDFSPGANWVAEIARSAAGAERILALLSPAYLSSRWAQAEWTAAFEEDPTGMRGRLVPVRIHPVKLEGLLSQIVYIDLVGLDEQEARDTLLRGLSKKRSRPAKPPAFPGLVAERTPPVFPSPENGGLARLAAIPLDHVPPPAPLPPGSRVPFASNPDFVGRKAELRIIAECFAAEENGPSLLLVHGTDGIGKTALAAEFAHRYGQYFSGGAQWINCSDEKSIPAEVAASGIDLALRPELSDLPLNNQVRLIKEAWNGATPRLLIFDGCEDREILERWIPDEGGSRVLITSRSLNGPSAWPLSNLQVLTLRPISESQGLVLLRRYQRGPVSSDESLATLYSELGGLPLALHLAGALLRDHTADDLLRGLREERSRSTRPLRTALDWSLDEAFSRLDDEGYISALARSLAFRAAHFAPSEPIPLSLLAASVEKDVKDPALPGALQRLKDLGLVTPGDDGIVLHPGVASWLRQRAGSEDARAVERAVYLGLKDFRTTHGVGLLIPWQAHLRVVTDAAQERKDGSAAQLCAAFAQHLADIGDREGALPYQERAVAIWETLEPVGGSELADALESLGNLLKEGSGEELGRARAAYERAVQLHGRSGGEYQDSIALARVLYQLGLIALARGDRKVGRSYFERSLILRELMLGPDAPDTIAVRNQLQFLLGEQGLAERDFLQLVPWGKLLLSRLRRDGASITQLRVIGPNRWILRSRIPEELQEAYGTAPEILFLVVHDEVKGEDLQTARKELLRKDFDLDPDLLVIIDDGPRLKERLGRLPLQWGQWVPWSSGEDGFPPLAELFREHLPLYDVFEQRDPVRGRQVIGRNTIVSDLRKRVQQGQAVGVFGLRKMGKTTVVRAVTDWLDPLSAHPNDREDGQSSILAVWLDSERLVERTLDSLAIQLHKELRKRLSTDNRAPLPEVDPADLGGLLEAALERTDLPICVVLDEYDLLFEGSGGQPAIAGIEKLFRAFRAVAQQTSRLSLVVIGRDSGFFENPEMNGWPNPMLNWLVPFWLGPLSADGADELLGKLGRRVLLDVGRETASLARAWTGGHPLLHRQFGSALLEKSRARKGDSREHVATDPFREEALDLFLARDAVTTICREVSHLLTSRYPEAAALLERLCCTSPQEAARLVEERGGWLRAESRLLRNLGLLLGDSESLWIPEVFRWYLRTLAPRVQGRRA
jgi:tetratricopeptide (TPR) repeat protein